MFASKVKKVVQLKNGVRVVLRKLSWKSLDVAETNRQIEVMQFTAALGTRAAKILVDESKDDVKELSEENKERQRKKDPRADVYRRYDRESTLIAGIESWDAPHPEKEGQIMPLLEGIKDLEEEYAEELFKEIIDLSVPDKATSEEAEKNDSGVSISI